MGWYWEQISRHSQIFMNPSIDLFTDKAAILNYDSQGAQQRSNILASIYARFSRQFFFKFPTKRLQWEKKIVVPCLDVIMIAFFWRNIQWSSLFAWKACVNTEQVPPRHPIILLKSNKFIIVTVLVKRSIAGVPMSPHPALKGRGGGG